MNEHLKQEINTFFPHPGRFTLVVFAFFILFALFAELLANDKPMYVSYQGQRSFPVLRNQSWQGVVVQGKQIPNDQVFIIRALIPYSPTALDYYNTHAVSPFGSQAVPSLRWRHWLGTDELGRDVLAGMIYGARVAMMVGLFSMLISVILGLVVGMVAGFFGDDKLTISIPAVLITFVFSAVGFFLGFIRRWYILTDLFGESPHIFIPELLISVFTWLSFLATGVFTGRFVNRKFNIHADASLPADLILMRIVETVLAIPVLFLVVALVAVGKPSLFTVIFIIGLTSWTSIAKYTRAEMLRIRELEYFEAAKALGTPVFRLLFNHALPNAVEPALVAIAFGFAGSVLMESSLSFLGIGVPADRVTWGSILSEARSSVSSWWLALFPGLAIFLVVMACNRLGEAWSAKLDPKQRRR